MSVSASFEILIPKESARVALAEESDTGNALDESVFIDNVSGAALATIERRSPWAKEKFVKADIKNTVSRQSKQCINGFFKIILPLRLMNGTKLAYLQVPESDCTF
jgi:hypothetical protein